MADPYTIGTFSDVVVGGSNTINRDFVTIGIGTLANLRGFRKRTQLQHTIFQSPGEQVPPSAGGALYLSAPIVSRDRVGGAPATGTPATWPLVNVRMESVTPYTATASPKLQTGRQWGIRVDDNLDSYCSTPWMPEIDHAGALGFVRAAHYGGAALPWGVSIKQSLTGFVAICPTAPTAHPGNVVPLLGKEYPPLLTGNSRVVTRGPSDFRSRLSDISDDIFWIWPNGRNSPAKLAWRAKAGWFHPWWGMPPFVEVWVNDFIFINSANPTPSYQMEIHIEQETVVYSAGSWRYVYTDTIIDTMTIPLSTRWLFSAPTEVCAWAQIANAASVGTLAANTIAFRYYAISKRDGSATGTTYLPGSYSSSVNGIWCKASPNSPNWATPGGTGELYQTGLALQTDL